MHIADQERASVLEDLGGDEADCALVCTIIETVQQAGRGISYDVKRVAAGTPDEYLRIRLAKGFEIFTEKYARRVYGLSRRIRDIQLLFSRRQVHVHVAPKTADLNQQRSAWSPVYRRTCVTAIDFTASNVTDADDTDLMGRIVDDVYATAKRMPNTQFWFEPIAGGGATFEKTGAAIPLTAELAEEASIDAPEPARVGYSLCFADVPDLSAAFFRHLLDEYGPRVASVYAWLDCSQPLLVVNIRRTTAPSSVVIQNVTNHVPKPLLIHKRARDHDDDSGTLSGGRAKRTKRAK